MGYKCKAQKGLSVFTGSVISFLMLTSSGMASTVDKTASTDVAVKPVQTASLKNNLKIEQPNTMDSVAKPVLTTKTNGEVMAGSSSAADYSAAADEFAKPEVIDDPYEGYNRIMFDFDDRVDTTILKPVGTFYNKIMPKPLNQGVHNFFNNINNVPTIINDLLQFNFYQMANDLWRLTINTTVGVVGIFDVASRMNLEQYDNDFGLTLAKWGYRNSNYFVLPFWGPKTIRDAMGMPVDYFAFSVYPYIEPKSAEYGLYALSVVDARAQRLKVENVMEEATLDKYVFVRNAYMQNRAYKIKQNDHRTFADLDKGTPVPDSPETVAENNVDDEKLIPDEANAVSDDKSSS